MGGPEMAPQTRLIDMGAPTRPPNPPTLVAPRGTRGAPRPRESFTRLLSLAVAAPPLGIVVWLFFVPILSSAHLSFLRDGQWTLRNYALVWRLYKGDVLYTLGISLVSLVLVIGIATLLCGYP